MLSLFQRKRVPPAAGTPPTSAIETPKGAMRPESAASLLTTPRRQKLLEHIWQRTSLSRRQFATLYLAGHNRPPHEVLFGNDKDIAAEYERAFVGMTEVECSLDTLLAARAQIRQELPQRLTTSHQQFLSGLVRAEPDWSLMQCAHAAELPALRWKLANLEAFRKRRPADFEAQANALDSGLGQV